MKQALKFIPPLLALLIFAAVLASLDLDWQALRQGDLESATAAMRAVAERQGPLKPYVLVALVGLLPFVLVPITVVWLSVALLLPSAQCVAVIVAGSTLNTALAWWAGRVWGGGLLKLFGMEDLGPLKVLRQGAKEHGFKMGVLSRFLPIPFALTGMAAPLAGLAFKDMVGGSFVILIPWALLYAFFTDALRRGDMKGLFWGLALFALLTAVGWWLRRRRPAAQQAPQRLSPQSPALGPVLTLYTLPGHDACNDARRELWALRVPLGFEVEEVDLSVRADLDRQYHDHVPLVFLKGQKIFSFQVDENALKHHLKAARD